MREIIKVKIGTQKANPVSFRCEMLCIGCFADDKKLNSVCKQLDDKLNGALSQIMKLGDFKGNEKSHALIYSGGKISAKRIMLVGLGERKKAHLDTLRTGAAYAANQAVNIKTKTIGLALHQPFDGLLETADSGEVVAEGVYFGSYRYDEFLSGSENGRIESLNAIIVDDSIAAVNKLKKGSAIGSIIGNSQNLARTIANRPANTMYPEIIAQQAKKIAAGIPNLSCTVFNFNQLKQKKMGGLIAVGQGSSHKPCMAVLRYKPKKSKIKGTIGLIGKALCFDSGGISIKPSDRMDQMKMDKTGGAAVLGAIKAIAELKLPVNVTAVICAAENAPGGDSYRPGDIITTYSKKTIEVLNTDAEGRIILSDGITYAKQNNCEPIIDIATLTGACMVALGVHKAGLMGNDDGLIKDLQAAADRSGEPVWHLPSGNEYTDEMKSKIADLKNIGSRYGGASTAASFLGEFAGDTKWAHLDIAGKMDPSDPLKKIASDGSIGFGVRLFVAYLMNLAGKSKK
ncbi:MAG: leucyl aminopeptidase [Phycisphaerae bacterium]